MQRRDVENIRLKILEAYQELKKLEVLKEKEKKTFLAKQMYREQAITDEAAQTIFLIQN